MITSDYPIQIAKQLGVVRSLPETKLLIRVEGFDFQLVSRQVSIL